MMMEFLAGVYGFCFLLVFSTMFGSIAFRILNGVWLPSLPLLKIDRPFYCSYPFVQSVSLISIFFLVYIWYSVSVGGSGELTWVYVLEYLWEYGRPGLAVLSLLVAVSVFIARLHAGKQAATRANLDQDSVAFQHRSEFLRFVNDYNDHKFTAPYGEFVYKSSYLDRPVRAYSFFSGDRKRDGFVNERSLAVVRRNVEQWMRFLNEVGRKASIDKQPGDESVYKAKNELQYAIHEFSKITDSLGMRYVGSKIERKKMSDGRLWIEVVLSGHSLIKSKPDFFFFLSSRLGEVVSIFLVASEFYESLDSGYAEVLRDFSGFYGALSVLLRDGVIQCKSVNEIDVEKLAADDMHYELDRNWWCYLDFVYDFESDATAWLESSLHDILSNND